MKLKHRIRHKVLEQFDSNDCCFSAKTIRKAVEVNFIDDLSDPEERKQTIIDQIQKLVDKNILVLGEDNKLRRGSNTDGPALSSKRSMECDEPNRNSAEHDAKRARASSEVESVASIQSITSKDAAIKQYPPCPEKIGSNTILLFYAYCDPIMTVAEQDAAIAYCYKVLTTNKVTGRLRVGREGFNSTLTGPHDGVRAFTAALREKFPATFSHTDFKYVDNQPDSQLLKGLKVWPVKEIVTYGFNPEEAPLDLRGTHLSPQEFHKALENPNSVVIDVRNFNEALIGKFAPPTDGDPNEKVLDPCMRRSTEFPDWVQTNRHKLEGKQVLMYCTAGVRCERASAFMRYHGIQNVYQLEGGIHRYLDAYPEDGGHWIGKNYVFDKRFSHGAKNATVVSQCVCCSKPWERYQAQWKCCKCAMEVLVCKDCTRVKPAIPKSTVFCPLCAPKKKHVQF